VQGRCQKQQCNALFPKSSFELSRVIYVRGEVSLHRRRFPLQTCPCKEALLLSHGMPFSNRASPCKGPLGFKGAVLTVNEPCFTEDSLRWQQAGTWLRIQGSLFAHPIPSLLQPDVCVLGSIRSFHTLIRCCLRRPRLYALSLLWPPMS